jgi:hypothetical protein
MIKNEKTKIWINRVFAFVVGGLLLFLIMNFSVAEKLRKELDESKYAAGRLLNAAKTNIGNKNYSRAKESLDMLAEKHPGSNEAVEGYKLYNVIENAEQADQVMQAESDFKWNEAVEGVRMEWERKTAGEMRDKIAKERDQLEKDMSKILSEEWEKNENNIRKEWEERHGEA